MNYGEIKKADIANGTGVRVSLFVSGCRNHCKNCFNKDTWDFKYGRAFTKEIFDEIVEALSKNFISGLTLIGGEPFEPENQRVLVNVAKEVKRLFPQKDIWCYTGFTFEDIIYGKCRAKCEVTEEFLSYIDVIVDGKFIEEQKDISLKFRGSKNQRIINVKDTICCKSVVLCNK